MLTQGNILLFLSVFLVSVCATGIVRKFAHHFGFVSRPKSDRWASRTVALGGGIGVIVAIAAGILTLGGTVATVVLPAIAAIFLLGLVDDIWGTSPPTKLIGQVAVAAYIVTQGFTLSLPWQIPAVVFTIVWIVGVTNAVNLIDNMDGLAAGATTIAALGFAYLSASYQSEPASTQLAVILAGAALGFLVHNFHPAKIFLGDAGSLPIGLMLGILSTKVRFTTPQVPQFLSLIPVFFVLVIPVFDTLLVMVARRSIRRPMMSGGRDHSSHRLVALGLSEKMAVSCLYVGGTLGLIAAAMALRSSLWELLAITMAVGIGMTLFAVFLLDIAVYPPELLVKRNLDSQGFRLNPVPAPILYLVELALDISAISVSWALAHIIRFQDMGVDPHQLATLIPVLPFIIATKLIALSLFKLHRGLWRVISTQDVYRIFKATTVGTLLVVVGLAVATRMADVSRLVIVLDWLLTFLALVGTRAANTAFNRWFRRLSSTPRRAALVGSVAFAPLAKRAVDSLPGTEFSGVISTDGVSINHNSYLGDSKNMQQIIEERHIDLLLVATDSLTSELSYLAAKGIQIRQVRLQVL